ncbi:hypothetical protein [Pedobacter sp. GR22-6]|uniref:hypothetical protein n=1 Tax=Pedobacter sp. GR22-6 TaxID=3127957 RepID=UPI00307E6C6B
MNNEPLLTLQEIERFMEKHKNNYVNANGIEIDLTNELCTTAVIWNEAPVKFILSLAIDRDDPKFSKKLGLKSVAELDNLNINNLWSYYMGGWAHVCACTFELFQFDLIFKAVGWKTLISADPERSYRIGLEDGISRDVDTFRAYVKYNLLRFYEEAEQKRTVIDMN